jgi:hypothetical protein
LAVLRAPRLAVLPRFAVARFAPPVRFVVARFAVVRFAVPVRFAAPPRFAVVLRREVALFADAPVDFFRPVALLPLELRRVVLRPPFDDAFMDDGIGGVGLAGIGVGHTDPGSFCSDQSVP